MEGEILACVVLKIANKLERDLTFQHRLIIVKQGNEQRDYVTVNYSVTLELRAK